MGNRKWLDPFVVGPVAGSARGYYQSEQGKFSWCFSKVWCVEHATIDLWHEGNRWSLCRPRRTYLVMSVVVNIPFPVGETIRV